MDNNIETRIQAKFRNEEIIESNRTQQNALEKLGPKRRKLKVEAFTYIRNIEVLISHRELNLANELSIKALNNFPKEEQLILLRAILLEKSEHGHEMLSLLEKADSCTTTFESKYKLAQSYYAREMDHLAFQKYYEALALITSDVPELFEIHKNLGNLYVKQGDFESAEENYNKAHTMNKTSDSLHVNYGTLEVQKGDYDRALWFFRRAIELNPRNDKAWVGLGLVHSQYGDPALAFANIVQACELNYLNRTAIYLLSLWSTNQSITQFCLEKVGAYLIEVENDPEISLLHIKNLISVGRQDLAVLEISRAFLFSPENTELENLFLKAEFN